MLLTMTINSQTWLLLDLLPSSYPRSCCHQQQTTPTLPPKRIYLRSTFGPLALGFHPIAKCNYFDGLADYKDFYAFSFSSFCSLLFYIRFLFSASFWRWLLIKVRGERLRFHSWLERVLWFCFQKLFLKLFWYFVLPDNCLNMNKSTKNLKLLWRRYSVCNHRVLILVFLRLIHPRIFTGLKQPHHLIIRSCLVKILRHWWKQL